MSVGQTIVAGIVAAVGGAIIVDLMNWNLILKLGIWIWAAMVWAWGKLFSSFSIPGWAIMVVGAFALVGLAGCITMAWQVVRDDSPASHGEVIVRGAKWTWVRTKGGAIRNLVGFCPTCDAELIHSYDFVNTQTHFICEHCPPDNPYSPGRTITTIKGGEVEFARAAIRREIRRRERTGGPMHSDPSEGDIRNDSPCST